MVSDSVSKTFSFKKKYRIRYQKHLVSKKVSDSVSEKIGIRKKFRIRFRSDFGYRHTLMIKPIVFKNIKPFPAWSKEYTKQSNAEKNTM